MHGMAQLTNLGDDREELASRLQQEYRRRRRVLEINRVASSKWNQAKMIGKMEIRVYVGLYAWQVG